MGNVFNLCVIFAYNILQCNSQIFIGNELTINEKEYYADGTTPESLKRAPLAYAVTIRGKAAHTMPSFYQYKLVLENMLGKLPGFFINATEDGILGQTHRYGRIPWIHQYRLEDAIKLAKRSYKKAKHKEAKFLAQDVAAGYVQARKNLSATL